MVPLCEGFFPPIARTNSLAFSERFYLITALVAAVVVYFN